MIYLWGLGITLIAEAVALLILHRSKIPAGLQCEDVASLLTVSLGWNLISHPLAFAVHTYGFVSTPVIEVVVVLVEAAGFAMLLRIKFTDALVCSFVANGGTIVLSYLLTLSP
ncbi:MAG TPA: hypothetical protein PKA37_18430 [Planctomycetota bacterium]|nr:hypothetical protein [Planctomycetota bacterium]